MELRFLSKLRTRVLKYTQLHAAFLLCILSSQYVIDAATNRTKMQDYGIIIDAGSSGSRVRVYVWDESSWFPGNHGNLPEIAEEFNLKVSPGISDFGGNITGVEEYMDSLLQEAKTHVPEEKYHSTPIYLFATAGMRLLMADDADHVMDEIDRILSDRSINPFVYESHNARILSGEEEGVFAWITVNYLRAFFKRDSGTQDAGILELGGASAQIAFRHDGDILADKFPIMISGIIYPLYVHSYLGFGQEQTMEKINEMAVEREQQVGGERENPCMIKDDAVEDTVNDLEVVTFRGTGIPESCFEYMDDIIYEPQDEDHCLPKPCAIGTVYQPSIDENMPFYALSAYLYALDTLGVLHPVEQSFTITGLRQAAATFLEMGISEVERVLNRTSKFNSIEVAMGAYIAVQLDKGYMFSDTSRQIYAFDKIDGQPIQWALGALIYETERSYDNDCDVITVPSAAPSFHGSNVACTVLVIISSMFACTLLLR